MCAFAGAGIIGSRLCRRVCSCHTKLIQPVQPQTLPFICIMHDIKTRLKPSILIYYSPECRSFFFFFINQRVCQLMLLMPGRRHTGKVHNAIFDEFAVYVSLLVSRNLFRTMCSGCERTQTSLIRQH